MVLLSLCLGLRVALVVGLCSGSWVASVLLAFWLCSWVAAVFLERDRRLRAAWGLLELWIWSWVASAWLERCLLSGEAWDFLRSGLRLRPSLFLESEDGVFRSEESEGVATVVELLL